MVRPLASPALLVLVASQGLACNGVPSDGADAESAASSTFALVSVQHSSSAAGQAPRVEVVARFVRSRTEASSTFAALGATLGMPQLGSCASLSALASTADEPGGAIELLDVGRVEVASTGSPPTALEPRELPNLGDFARGTFYALSPSPPAAFGGLRAVNVTVGGSSDFAPVVISGRAPQEPSDITFNGVAATGSSINLNNGRSVRLTWAVDDPHHASVAGETADIVYIDTNDAASHETRRCAFADTASAEMPLPAGEHGQIEVHRLRRHAATPTTELRFDFYRSFTF